MREKADSDLVRRQNRCLVLDALRRRGPLARVELGRLTGLSPATITSIAGQLLDDGVAVERHDVPVEGAAARRGRPLIHVDLNPAATRVLAMKISIAGLELALADYRGTILSRYAAPLATYEAKAGDFAKAVVAEIKAFLARERLPRRRVSRIGIAVQGAADSPAGAIIWSPAFRARNISLVAPITAATGIACSIGNDANMMAEALDRDAFGGTSAVVFMGYGVGMGLIMNGQVYHGPTGAAAEFGHMNHIPGGALCRCGRNGCIEAYAADYAILRSADGRPDDHPPFSSVPEGAMRQLESRARSGETRAAAAYAKAGEALGYGLARLTALLSPNRIVLAGPGAGAMDLIEPHLRRAFAEAVVEELRRNTAVEVQPIGTDMIVTGTIASALRALDTDVFSVGSLQRDAMMEKTA